MIEFIFGKKRKIEKLINSAETKIAKTANEADETELETQLETDITEQTNLETALQNEKTPEISEDRFHENFTKGCRKGKCFQYAACGDKQKCMAIHCTELVENMDNNPYKKQAVVLTKTNHEALNLTQ